MVRLMADNLSKAYSNQIALNDLNLDLEFNGLGLLGPNGSGKTTLIKLLLGIIKPTEGSIYIDASRRDIRVVSDQPRLPERMSINEWIYTLERIYGEHIAGIDIQTDLGLEGQWKISNLSAGQRRKASLLPAFYGVPDLIIIDEPSNFLDITTREYVIKLLKQHVDQTGSSIIISSHSVEEVRAFADTVILLKDGRLVDKLRLDQDQPEYISVKANQLDQLEDLFRAEQIEYSREKNIEGEVIKIPPQAGIWEVIEHHTKKGGMVQSIKAIDKLEMMIQEITQ